MSDVTELEQRMQHMEKILAEIGKKVNRIEQGIFGDDDIDHVGIIDRVKKLEDEVKQIRQVNDNQEIEIQTKKNVTDNIVIWLQRTFWGGAVLLVVMLLLTGKIGFLDLIRGLMD